MKRNRDWIFTIDARFKICGRTCAVSMPVNIEFVKFRPIRRAIFTDAEIGKIILERLPREAARLYVRDVVGLDPRTRRGRREFSSAFDVAFADVRWSGPPKLSKRWFGDDFEYWDRPPRYFELEFSK